MVEHTSEQSFFTLNQVQERMNKNKAKDQEQKKQTEKISFNKRTSCSMESLAASDADKHLVIIFDQQIKRSINMHFSLLLL